MFHRFGHVSRIYYRVGSRIKKGQEIGEIGNANGYYSNASHLHYDIFKEKPRNFLAYTKGMTKEQVLDVYADPRPFFSSEIPVKFSHMGHNFMEVTDSGLIHPGLDLNGPGGGDADHGNKIYSPVNGTVSYVRSPQIRDGWGGVMVIEHTDEDDDVDISPIGQDGAIKIDSLIEDLAKAQKEIKTRDERIEEMESEIEAYANKLIAVKSIVDDV
jgi:murein DD-endopeptidase MepM/ murein hydrolase activator NlpD